MRAKFLLTATAVALATTLAAASAQASANLVNNGSFETGDFTDWTQFGDTSFTGVELGCFDAGCPTDGAYLAAFGPVGGNGGITQTLANNAGNFNVSFDLSNDSGDFFEADFGGVTLLVNPPTESTTHYAFSNVSVGAGAALTFTTFNAPAYYTLDNISVSGAVPEPMTWALMISGFGLAGASLRRRRAVAATA